MRNLLVKYMPVRINALVIIYLIFQPIRIFAQGADCASALANIININSGYSASGQTTCGKGNDYDLSNIVNYCGDPLYMYGEDNLYAFTPSSDGYIVVSISSATDVYSSIAIYYGCPSTGICIGSTTTQGASKSVEVHVASGNTYYVVIDYWPDGGTNTCFTYNINITAPGSLSGTAVPNNQDCIAAIPVCKPVYTQPNSYTSEGNILTEINSSASCLDSGELNDVWYSFNVQKSGNLSFIITPNADTDDYDWSVYNLTNAQCSSIYSNSGLEVSCNYSGDRGVTGANGGSTLTSQDGGGTVFNAVIPVKTGESYVLNVSNFSGSQSGYTLDFSASTAVIFDNTGPSMVTAVVSSSCQMDSLTLTFSENVMCSSIDTADFTLTNSAGTTYTVHTVGGSSITNKAPYGKTFTLGFSPAITQPGNYTLNLVGAVVDVCGNVSSPHSIPVTLNYESASSLAIKATPYSCNVKSNTLCAPSGYSSYAWTLNGNIISGATTNCITGSEPGIYCVSVSTGSCYKIAVPLILN